MKLKKNLTALSNRHMVTIRQFSYSYWLLDMIWTRLFISFFSRKCYLFVFFKLVVPVDISVLPSFIYCFSWFHFYLWITTFTIAVKKKNLLLLLSPLDLYKKMTREQSKSAGESVLKIQLEIGNLVTVGRSQAYQPCLMCVNIDWNYMKWFFNQYFYKVYIMPFKKQNLDFEVFCSCWKLCLSWAILSYRHQQGLVYVHRVYLVARIW